MMSASEDGTIRLWDIELLIEGGEMDAWEMDFDYGYGIYSVRSPELPFRHPGNTRHW